MSVLNFNNYKKAKILVKDLTQLSEILNKAYFDLSKFVKYVPAKEARKSIKEQLQVIHIHLPKYKKILESKGEAS